MGKLRQRLERISWTKCPQDLYFLGFPGIFPKFSDYECIHKSYGEIIIENGEMSDFWGNQKILCHTSPMCKMRPRGNIWGKYP